MQVHCDRVGLPVDRKISAFHRAFDEKLRRAEIHVRHTFRSRTALITTYDTYPHSYPYLTSRVCVITV